MVTLVGTTTLHQLLQPLLIVGIISASSVGMLLDQTGMDSFWAKPSIMATSTPISDINVTTFTPSAGSDVWATIDDYPGTGDYSDAPGDDETITLKVGMASIHTLPESATLKIYLTASNSPFITLESYTLYDNISVMASDTAMGEPINDYAHEISIPLTINSVYVSGNTSLELTFNFIGGGPYGVAIYGIKIDWTYTPPPSPSGARAAALALLANWPN